MLCRSCLSKTTSKRCLSCGSPRILAHPELWELGVAHVDCDAFFASVEKRDDPSLQGKPLIIGGGHRGVVSTACYLARTRGVRSAMPMFKALKLCPEAVVLRGRMEVYAEASRRMMTLMRDLTPAVEPLSLDEAFLDLRGTGRLHGATPAELLALLAQKIEAEVGITVSVGLSYNKFLAKVASDLDKPKGFSVIGEAQSADFLRDKSVRIIWGVGPAMQEALEAAGISTFADLLRWDRKDLSEKFGQQGARLWSLARGQDTRIIAPSRKVKSISKETTFPENLSDRTLLEAHLWRLAEQVADRAKAKGLAGGVVLLKVRGASFQIWTKRITLGDPTQMAELIYRAALPLLSSVMHHAPFRLIGTGLSDLCPASTADRTSDFLDPELGARLEAEKVRDEIKARFGAGAISKGRSFIPK